MNMSASPLLTNMQNAVQAALVAKGAPTLYAPDLEYILVQALVELSTDALVDAPTQAVFIAQIALATGDAGP